MDATAKGATASVLTRSQMMARIRSSGNKTTEIRLILLFRANKILGWRRKARLIGRPDFVFPLQKVAVFVDGCYWHGCPAHYKLPSTNIPYWSAKIARNRRRDRHVSKTLRRKGWTVIRIWEHSLKPRNSSRLINRLQRSLAASNSG